MHVHANSASQGAHNIAIEFFGDHLDEFRRHLLGQSHAESTVVQYLHRIGTLAEMMKAHGIGLVGLDEAQAVTLIAKKSHCAPQLGALRCRDQTGWLGD